MLTLDSSARNCPPVPRKTLVRRGVAPARALAAESPSVALAICETRMDEAMSAVRNKRLGMFDRRRSSTAIQTLSCTIRVD
jgi:hypothetical protein